MIGFNRVESLKNAVKSGRVEFAMMLTDFHLVKGTITQSEYDEIYLLAYPNVEETP